MQDEALGVFSGVDRPVLADFVEKLGLLTAAVGGGVSLQRGKAGPSASSGEDERRNGDKLRQLPQILGGGGQEEFIFGSVWSAQA